MDRAKAGLQNNPDVGEILGDVERAIGEKCAAKLHSGKGIVTTEDMAAVLHEVGPIVEDPIAAPGPEESKAPKEPRRLYRQPKGAMVGGVCMGLSEYFGLDVVLFRLIFAVLALASGGIGGGLYLIMMMVVPSREPKTLKKKAAWRSHPAASAILIAGTIVLIGALGAFVTYGEGGLPRWGMLPIPRILRVGIPYIFFILTMLFPIGMIAAIVVGVIALIKYLVSGTPAKE
jgi:phage shock protein PspC (stress-responsive transcriptional regulator)